MIRRIVLFFAVAALCTLSSCKKDADVSGSIVGEWELSYVDFVTRSALVGDETVTVYLSFAGDGTFALYQIIGEGRAASFSGTWRLSEDILSGAYSDGTKWSSSYEVSVEKDRLTLTTEDGNDVFVYKSCTIPYDRL